MFIGWGSFYNTGGQKAGLTKSAITHIWGITVAVMVLGAHIPALSTIPAAVRGDAATAGLCLLSGVAIGESGPLLSAAGMVLVSLIRGTCRFGVMGNCRRIRAATHAKACGVRMRARHSF